MKTDIAVFCRSMEEVNDVINRASKNGKNKPTSGALKSWQRSLQRCNGIYISMCNRSNNLGHCGDIAGTKSMYLSWGYRVVTTKEFIDNLPIEREATPSNNDGRTSCFWCSAPTRKANGGLYDVCTVCGK